MTSIAERRAEAEVAALRRSFRHGFTSLDVARRRWVSLSATGKQALTTCVNCQSRLSHAEGPHWPAAIRNSAVRSGVAWRSFQERDQAQYALLPVMNELEGIVASMRRTASELRARSNAAAHVLGTDRSLKMPLLHTESAQKLGVCSHLSFCVHPT
jgi:hypothetical protein